MESMLNTSTIHQFFDGGLMQDLIIDYFSIDEIKNKREHFEN